MVIQIFNFEVLSVSTNLSCIMLLVVSISRLHSWWPSSSTVPTRTGGHDCHPRQQGSAGVWSHWLSPALHPVVSVLFCSSVHLPVSLSVRSKHADKSRLYMRSVGRVLLSALPLPLPFLSPSPTPCLLYLLFLVIVFVVVFFYQDEQITGPVSPGPL